MSYTGFFADDHLYEVAKDGDPEKGSWVVPVERADDYRPTATSSSATDPDTGERSRVRYAPGTFVFRLAGRDRQQSRLLLHPRGADPVHRHAGPRGAARPGRHRPRPREILDLTDLRAGAGLRRVPIEAVSQLADAVPAAAARRSWASRIDPEEYPRELQKVKAYLALHNCYGVDLNATAVELAEISLWLDTMHAGLQAPWFGLHLRRGNSLIGARRETWTPDAAGRQGGWLTTAPTAPPARDEPVDARTESTTSCCPPTAGARCGRRKEAKERRADGDGGAQGLAADDHGARRRKADRRSGCRPSASGSRPVGARAAAAGRSPSAEIRRAHRRLGRRGPAGGHRRGARGSRSWRPDGPGQRRTGGCAG